MGNHAWIGRTLRTAAWAPILVVVAYSLALVALGSATPPWLDSIAHAGGGIAMAYFGDAALNHLQARVGETPRTVRLIAAVGFTAVVAIAWELLEFIVDFTSRTRLAPSVGDTLLDLALGLAGAVAFALAAAVTGHRNASRS
jgi:hypothetical protein